MELARVHLIVSGRVQGVAFRASAQQAARQLSLTGWVRNHSNGNVEITAEGPKGSLADFIDWANHGPRYAAVEHLSIDWQTADGGFTDFLIIN